MSNPLKEKSYSFALRIVRLNEYLHNEKREFVISKKILDSGINIGLFIEEGRQGDDRVELRQKYSIANKEAFKTNFLLRILRDAEHIKQAHAKSLIADCEELQKMLISAIKTLRQTED
jgi:four helix bundle protein